MRKAGIGAILWIFSIWTLAATAAAYDIHICTISVAEWKKPTTMYEVGLSSLVSKKKYHVGINFLCASWEIVLGKSSRVL